MKRIHRITFIVFLLTVSAALMFGQGKTTKGKSMESSKQGEMPGAKGKQTAVLETSMGTIEFELYGNDAPKTVENFVGLAKKNYFDGVRFHRVVKGFVIQTGDDKSKDLKKAAEWGTGGTSVWGKEFEDELNPNTPSAKEGYKKGVVAMANRGPNTNTSQFFICLQDVRLPLSYTIFGKVTKGLDIVEKIGAVETVRERPKTDVLVTKVTIK